MSGWIGGNGRHPERIADGLRNHFVYWLYDAAGNVLYIGCTRRPEARWREHAQGSYRQMVSETSRRRMAGPYDYDYATARRIERSEQIRLRPKYGRAWKQSAA